MHNFEKVEEYKRGEEGIDFVKQNPDEEDPNAVNQKKLEKEIKGYLNAMRADGEVELAEYLQKQILSKDTYLDKAFAQGVIPEEEIKFYPGSAKGPAPEDDPESYSRWFIEHQPPSTLIDGVINSEELGVKKKIIRMVRDEAAMNEIKQASMYYFDQDELYPMQNFTGQPEFELFNRDNYNVNDFSELPQVTFMSNTGVNELAP